MVLLKLFESRGFALALNRKILLCTIALGLSGLFVCLGFWQLTRRAENLAGAQTRLERFAQPPFEWTDNPYLLTRLVFWDGRLASVGVGISNVKSSSGVGPLKDALGSKF